MKALISAAIRIDMPFPYIQVKWDVFKIVLTVLLSLGTYSFDYEHYYELRDREINQEKINFAKDFAYYGYSFRDEMTYEIISRRLKTRRAYRFAKAQRFDSIAGGEYYSSFSKRKIEKRLLRTIPTHFHKTAKYYIRPILKISEKYQVDPFWVVSIIWTESHFRTKAVSHVGARGLMQIMPKTQKYLLKLLSIKRIRLEATKKKRYLRYLMGANKKLGYNYYKKNLVNIELGVFYLKRLLHLFQGNHRYATVAYNMGPTWTINRLKNNLPVGNKNLYIDKVNRAYNHIDKKFIRL